MKKKEQILLLCVVFFWYAQYIYTPFQTPYLTAIRVSSDLIGVIVGAYGVSQMLLRLPVGVLADTRNNHKLFIILGGFASGIASLFRVTLNNALGFLLGNLFSGLASALWISFMVLYTGYFEEADQKRATSQIILANNVGILLGFATSTLLYDRAGMRFICLLSVLSGGVCGLLAFLLPRGEEKKCRYTLPQLLEEAVRKRLLFFAFVTLLQQGVQMSSAMSFTSQVLRNLGASSALVGFASIIYMVAAVCWSKFSTTRFCMNLPQKLWISFIFLLYAFYCWAVPVCGSIPVICVLQILPGMSMGILFSYLTAEATKGVPKEKRSTALGAFQAYYALGLTVFPVITGALLERYDMNAGYLFLALMCLTAAGLNYLCYDRLD